MASTANAACPTNAQFTATDVVGDGCPAVNATFGGNERSMTVDPQGNVYITADSVNPQSVRRIDARTGNISIFAGAGSGNACNSGVSVLGTTFTQTDKLGDGCPVSFSGGFNGARGLGSDPYGNIIIPVTGDYVVHLVCTAVSPLCTAAQVRVNLMRNIAGCTLTTTGYGTSVSGTTVGTAGDGTNAVQIGGSSCAVGLNQPRQAVGDKWGNVYFNDSSNSRIRVVLGVPSITVGGATLTNPLYAAEAMFTATNSALAAPTQGFIYPIAGGASTTSGNAYAVCAATTDSGGDGCPFYQTTVGSTTYVQGEAVTPEGDFLFTDGLGNLRVIYLGGASVQRALAANGITAPRVGYSYALIGGTGTTNLYYNSVLSGTYLGTSVKLQSSATQRIATDSVGNVYIGDQAQVFFYDIYTGYVRRLGGGTNAGAGTTSCNSSAIGDGCPIAQSLFGAANSVLAVALDNLGNLYIQDLGNKLIRKVSTTTLPTTAVNSTQASAIVVHSPVAATVTVTAAPSPDFTVGSAACAASNTDGSNECTAPVAFAPKQLNLRNDPVTLAGTTGSTSYSLSMFLDGTSTGSALAFDPASAPATTVLGTSTTGNTTVLTDGQGNSYAKGTQGISRISSTGSVISVTTSSPTYFAVDVRGNVYYTNASSTQFVQATYSAASNTYTTSLITLPANLDLNGTLSQANTGPFTVDPNGNLFVADRTNLVLYRFNPTNGISSQITQTALTNPTAMTQDSYGNLLVIDGTTLLKIPAAGFPITAASPVANPAVTFPTPLAAPTAVAADQGENIYVADSGSIIALSLSGTQYAVPTLAGSGVAVDGAGNLYTASSTVAGITEVLRSAQTHNFGTDVSMAYTGVFLNTGATAATGFSQSDTGGNYAFLTPATPVAASGGTCNLSSTALAGGALCNTSIKFAPTATGSGPVPDVVALLPAANTIGALALNGTKNGSTATTTTAIAGNTSGLVYSTGVETTFTVTVTQSTGTPAGSVSVAIDGGTATTYALTAASASTATASVPVSGLSASSHTIVATYTGSSGIAGSTSSTTTFTIAQATTSVNWTPSARTQQFSAAVGTGVLDATATSGSTSIPGVFVYTATPAGGSAVNIHSATFLAIGSYSLAVTFTPTDSVDYSSATSSIPSYTVTKASTTAAVGASQFTVAADGSGNYTTVQAAVNALGGNGGSVYIKPGTYNGFITVVQPNVALRGLGGDPTAVVLIKSAGAFSNSGGVYQYSGEFTAANSNGAQLPSGSSLFSGDEGSATLVVAKGVNTAFSTTNTTPNGFYGENFTLVNTYDSDTTTTTTTYVNSNGNCATNAGPARTYNDLFNNGLLCASQALAIWTTSDLAVMNNVYSTSLQDTIYAGSQGAGGSGYVPARQYWFRGKVTGTVDYIFGDAAAVFDYSSIYTLPHGTGVAGTATIEAQNKATRTGSSSDYLSGYVMNSNVFTSYITGMTGLVFGRPYGTFSTYLMLNSYVDQVAPAGYIEFSGQTNLPTSTYAEYNDLLYTDPATGSPDLNGVIYTGQGGSSGAGVTGSRETTSQDPGTSEAANAVKTSLTLQQAQQYFPTNFLGSTVPAAASSTANWNPTAALASGVNAFVPTTALTSAGGQSVTILMRPQTPGLGAVTNGVYAIPTGTYTLTDSFNGTTTTLASGTLDTAGEAYYTTSSLGAGTHNLSFTYGGDANFSGSSTASAYVLTVTGTSTTTTLSAAPSPATYGQAVAVTATVAPASGTVQPGGTVVLTIDGTSTLTATVGQNGQANFNVTGLVAGAHTLSASYSGASTFTASSTAANTGITVNKATLTFTASCSNRIFGAANSCTMSITGYQYSDTAATVFGSGPTVTSNATPTSPAGTYAAYATGNLSAAGSANYILNPTNSTFTVTGGAAQAILFAPLPNFPHGGSYQLTARATSGLPVTYSITSGGSSASISGSTLTVTGTGLVTVQASQSVDRTGDYAAATPVTRSFTAQ